MITKNSSISLFVSCLIWLIRSHENKCRYKTRERENFSIYSIKFVVIRWDIRCWYRCRLQLTTWWKLSSACVYVWRIQFFTIRLFEFLFHSAISIEASEKISNWWDNPNSILLLLWSWKCWSERARVWGVRRALQKHTKKARYEDEISVQFSNYIFCI